MHLCLPARRCRAIICCVTLFLLLTVYLMVTWWNRPPDYIFRHPYFFFDLDEIEPRNPEQKCILPRLHPFHPSIWSYLKFPKDIYCKKKQPCLTFIDDGGKISYNESEVYDAGYEIGKNLFCHWAAVLRDGDHKLSYGNEVQLLEKGYQLPREFDVVRIRCKNYAGVEVYEMIHSHIHAPAPLPSASSLLKHPINVLIFGLDSMSRLSFIRHLPNTYRYLTEELNMTVLRGMNKVGDNSFPNLIPLLAGHKGYDDGLGSTSDYFDHWPLIWKNYSAAGYGTLYVEDFVHFGLFQYLAKGFRRPPVDHYSRPYWMAIENSSLTKRSSYMCYNSQPKYFIQLDYVKKFVSAYEGANRPYFGFSFYTELTHDATNLISSADRDFEEFFINLKNKGYLKNTILIVMSDHGHRFDSIRATEVGYIEERMPFYSIYIPQGVAALQPVAKQVLQQNSAKLVTPFDVYATLMDILHLATSDRPLGLTDPESERRGQTLFREVPLDRTCSEASIPVQFCTCQTDTPISNKDARAKWAADATVWNINDLLKDGGMSDVCATRTLRSIRSAHLVETIEREDSDDDKIRVMIETEPSGVFEALISIRRQEAKVLGEVSRLSPYGDQSDCIQNFVLRKFCYCANHLSG